MNWFKNAQKKVQSAARPSSQKASVTINGTTFSRFDDYSNAAYRSLEELLGSSVPDQRYETMSPAILAKSLCSGTDAIRVLDIGCGNAQSKEMFASVNPSCDWKGVEIEETYNISDLADLPQGVSIYDGVNIPFDDGAFDFCYSKQVFEHVRHPEALLAEIHRVLADDGTFFGSLSGGESYHWHSLFHFSPLGWKTVLDDNGFKLNALYSGIDALTLMLHHWSKNRGDLPKGYFGRSILNRALNAEPDKDLRAIRYENTLKLVFAGHLVFTATKT